MIGLNITIKAGHVPEEIARDIDKWEQELAYRIQEESRAQIDSSIPRGRLYRRGGFKRGASKGLGIGRKRARGAGTRIHRASAPGQAPAEDTGKLYKDITVRRMKSGVYRVRFGAGYAGYLEFGASARSTRNLYHEGAALPMMGPHRGGMLPRPFIMKAIEIAVQKTFARYQ